MNFSKPPAVNRDQPVIAIHLGLHSEHMLRIAQGILNYTAAHPEISLEDFCFFEDTEGFSTPVPPWTGRVDGAVMGLAREPGILEWIRGGKVPTVNVLGNLMDSSVVSVYADIEGIARIAVEHLFGAGYRSFLYVGWAQADNSHHYRHVLENQLQSRGCNLLAIECTTVELRATEDSLSEPKVDKRIIGLIKKATKPLAIVAINDKVAVGVCRFARKLGLTVPDEVAILGNGDTSVARIASPPITTIRCDFERIGYEAVRLVHRMIQGNRPATKNISVPGVELIARTSTVGSLHTTRSNMQRALDLIRRKACEAIKVPEIAAQMHMSTRTFEIQFAEEIGHSVGEELRRVRLERAKELLAKTELSINRIAGLVGYTDTAYFTRFFRQHVNQTPSEYRQRHGLADAERGNGISRRPPAE